MILKNKLCKITFSLITILGVSLTPILFFSHSNNSLDSNNNNDHVNNLANQILEQKTNITIGDMVCDDDTCNISSQKGYEEHEIKSIIVGYKNDTNPNFNVPKIPIYSISTNNNMLNLSMAVPDQNFSQYFTDVMQPNPDVENPQKPTQITKNFFNLVEYTSSSTISGNVLLNWSSQNPNINPNQSFALKDDAIYLLQMSFIGSNNKDVGFYIENKNSETELANQKYNAYESIESSAIEIFLSKNKSGGISILVPKTDNTSIGTWKIKDTATANKYLNMSIEEAYNQLLANPSDIKQVVDWHPKLLFKSMYGFPVSLKLDTAESRLEFSYGDNNDFKYVFYAQLVSNARHIYPYYFNPSSSRPGVYINIKKNFEDYSRDFSTISFKGTFLITSDWEIVDKNRYPSQVSIDEIKQLILKHVGNPAPGFGINDILLQNNSKADLIFDNAKGTISFNVVLTKFLDQKGNPITDLNGDIIGNRITIAGFKSIEPTKFILANSTFKNSDSTLIATEQNEAFVKDIILKNQKSFFNTLASDIGGSQLNSSSIRILSQVPNNMKGEIEVEAELVNGFLTSPYSLIATSSDTPLTFKFKIVNFKILTPSIFFDKVNLTSIVNQKYASDQNEKNIREYVIQNQSLFFQNLPKDINLENSSDFQIRINQKSNIADSSIDNGKSGFIEATFTISKYYDDKGLLAHNKQYNVIIYGFKLVTPTKINQRVTIPNMQDTLVSSIVTSNTDTEAIIKLMKENESLFISNTSIPEDFYNKLQITIEEISNTKSWQLQIVIVMNAYFDDQGNYSTIPSQPIYVQINGFKEIEPTKINGGSYHVNNKISSMLPAELDEQLLKKIVLDSNLYLQDGMKIISGSIPSDFGMNNIIITNIVPHNLNGYLDFEVNINNRFEDNNIGNITHEPFPKPAKITLLGFKNTSPTLISENNPLSINENYELLANSFPSDVAKIVDKIQKNQEVSEIEQNTYNQLKKFLYDNGFINTPSYSDTIISIKSITQISNLGGSFLITFTLNRYIGSNGELVDGQLESTKTINYFKSVTPTHVNDEISIFEITNPEYTIYTAEEVASNLTLIANVIKDYDLKNQDFPKIKIIQGDLPIDFNYLKNLEISNVTFNNITSRVSFDLQLNYYFNSYNGDIQNGFPWTDPVRITLSGFKRIPSTTINNIELSSDYFYPTFNHESGKLLKVDIQDKSNFKLLTAKVFSETKFTNSNQTNEIMLAFLNNLFFYTNDYYNNNTNDAMVVYNPFSRYQIKFDAAIIRNVNNNDGNITIQARAYGYYFYRSSKPILIQDNEGHNYAYINIQLGNFLTAKEYNNEFLQPYILIPVVVISGLLIIFFVVLALFIVWKSKKQKQGERFIQNDNE